jgi:carbon storage regulator CsrA
MLVLSRKSGDKIVLGNGITLTVVEVRGKRVRLAFDVPYQVRILRAEIACWQDKPAGGDRFAEPAFECDEKNVRPPQGGDCPTRHRRQPAGGPAQTAIGRRPGYSPPGGGEDLGGFGIAAAGHLVLELGVHRDDADYAQGIVEGLKKHPHG